MNRTKFISTLTYRKVCEDCSVEFEDEKPPHVGVVEVLEGTKRRIKVKDQCPNCDWHNKKKITVTERLSDEIELRYDEIQGAGQ